MEGGREEKENGRRKRGWDIKLGRGEKRRREEENKEGRKKMQKGGEKSRKEGKKEIIRCKEGR